MLKAFLTFLIMPFTFTVILIVFGIIQIHRSKLKSGKILLLCGTLLLFLFGNTFVSGLLLKPLEDRHEPLLYPAIHPSINKSNLGPVIVVLASGHFTALDFPITSQMGQSAYYRLAEGLRVHQALPGSRLILMGGLEHNDFSTGDIKIKLLNELGFDTDQIEVLPNASTTEEEALVVAEHLFRMNQTELILVTSARHMTRSMLLFEKTGLSPIPAPTRHSIMGPPKSFISYFIWSPGNLLNSHRAINEYAGMLWSKIRGKTQ